MNDSVGTVPLPDVSGDAWAEALTHEWLVTDGLGGYASGTVVGPNTRRYHGVLVAPLAPPLDRHVLLAKLDETLVIGGERYELGANEFQDGTIHPQGHRFLAGFQLDDGVPIWRYRVDAENGAGGFELEKRVWMERGHSTTLLSYALHGPASARLSLLPLCVFRDFHRETIGSDDWRFRIERIDGGLTVRAYAGARPYHLLIAPPEGIAWQLTGHGDWWWHLLHRAERERGLDYLDDLYSIGTIECELAPGAVLLVAPSVEPPDVVRRRLAELAKTTAGRCGPPLPLGEAARRAGEGSGAPSRGDSKAAAALTLALSQRERGRGSSPTSDRSEEEFLAQLRRAASQFLVTRAVPGEPAVVGPGGLPEARTVLAGYHWFGDWGRDTMIALPGLALATGRYAEARAILRAFARYVDRGMLPNRFPDTGVPLGDGDYNTVDASLWYFHAIDAIGHASLDASEADGDLVAELFPVLADIVDWHVRGTRFGIGVDPADGLVRVADPQLTWMDAKVGEWVMTPRAGKTVEIAALWIHALGLMERWADRLRRSPEASRYRELLRQAAGGFGTRFWYGDGGYLYDLLDGESGGDASLRPNQIIAAALPDCPLTPEQRRAVVDGVVERLWTPRGLRTLAPDDPRYRGRYQGDPRQRDGAYHQGTVWPWLLGPLVDAHLVVYRDPAAARRLVEPMRAHLFDEAGVGSISEIFDGDPPHAARGCIAQAWSVSEVYRAWMATAVGSRQ